MKQGELFAPRVTAPPPVHAPVARARRTDPETSQEAARSLSADTLRESQARVLRALVEQGPAHDYELIRRLEAAGHRVTRSGVQTRRSELARAGLVRDTGERVALDTGRRAIVWSATDAGRRRVWRSRG